MEELSPEERQQVAQLQQQMLGFQQEMMVQKAIVKLTETCYGLCVSSPPPKLSSKQTDCIKSCAGRYLDATNFLSQKLSNHHE